MEYSNTTISFSLSDTIEILNKTQSLDRFYGVYDDTATALNVMLNRGLTGRLVAVYTDKENGKVQLFTFNKTTEQLDPLIAEINVIDDENSSDITTWSSDKIIEYVVEQINNIVIPEMITKIPYFYEKEEGFEKDEVVHNEIGIYKSKVNGNTELLPEDENDNNYWELIATNGNNSGEANINVFENDISVMLSSNKTLGKYMNGDLIPAAGKTFEEVLNDIAKEAINPTFINPTFSLTHNQTSGSNVREVGQTLNVILTANFNKGQILGDNISGVWSPSTLQNDRAGDVINYIIDGTDTSLVNTKTISDYNVLLGNNTFTSSVNYSEGPQPLNSLNENYSTSLPAGTLNSSTQFIGSYKIFYGANNTLTNPRTLNNVFLSLTPVSNTIDLNTGTVSNTFHIFVPQGRVLDYVLAVEASNADITSQYIFQGLTYVNDAGGTPRAYNYYKMITDAPYSSPGQTHRIKFKVG